MKRQREISPKKKGGKEDKNIQNDQEDRAEKKELEIPAWVLGNMMGLLTE